MIYGGAHGVIGPLLDVVVAATEIGDVDLFLVDGDPQLGARLGIDRFMYGDGKPLGARQIAPISGVVIEKVPAKAGDGAINQQSVQLYLGSHRRNRYKPQQQAENQSSSSHHFLQLSPICTEDNAGPHDGGIPRLGVIQPCRGKRTSP